MKTAEFLRSRGIEFQLIPHRATYDAQHLAQALHTPGNEVAKTVLLRANGGYEYLVAVLPATRMVNLAQLSHVLGEAKVELASEIELAEHCPDCELGVLPPFGSQYAMRTVVDRSLAADEEIVFEANRHDEAVRMKFRDYQRVEEPLITEFAS